MSEQKTAVCRCGHREAIHHDNGICCFDHGHGCNCRKYEPAPAVSKGFCKCGRLAYAPDGDICVDCFAAAPALEGRDL